MLWYSLAFAADPAPRDRVAPLGTDRISELAELRFTFNVERDGELKASRAWTWHPADNTVTRTMAGESLTFVFGAPKDDAERKADAQFVNDSFWLAPQMHLRWAGPDLTVTDAGEGPIPDGVRPSGAGEGTARKIVMQYAPTGGGYTPGDAYDLFLDPNGRIVAWNYREGGAPEPSMTTSFDGYVEVGPLTLATEHRSPDGKLRLFFTDLAAK
jgi:hypothetical protein